MFLGNYLFLFIGKAKTSLFWLCFTAISQNVHNVMKQFVYRELFFAAKTFFCKTKQKTKDSTLLTKKTKQTFFD